MDASGGPGAAGRSDSTIRVTVLRSDGSGSDVKEAPSSEFETSDKGVTLGRLFLPWRRIQSYGWEVRTPADAEFESHARVSVRLVVDEGTPEGTTYTVTADRFETGPWTVTLLLNRRAEPDRGELVAERMVFPWHRVIEFERLIADDVTSVLPEANMMPARPDA
jgi:hypothetical protein